MQLHAPALEQRRVCRFPNERMLERVNGFRRSSALKHQAGFDDLAQRLVEDGRGDFSDRTDKLEAELTADDRATLSEFSCGAKAVEACRQQRAQAGRNGQ